MYTTLYQPIKGMSYEDKGRLLDAIFEYNIDGKEPVDAPPIVQIAFNFFKAQFELDAAKYDKIVERNRVNGKRGGRPKKPTGLLGLEKNPVNPMEPKKADDDDDDDDVLDISVPDISVAQPVKIDKEAEMKKRSVAFKETIDPFIETYGSEMCKEFYLYWSEPNKSKTKMRYELQKTWDVSRRLGTWARNNFNKKTHPAAARIQGTTFEKF